MEGTLGIVEQALVEATGGSVRHRTDGRWSVFAVDVGRAPGAFVVAVSDRMLQGEYKNQLTMFLAGSDFRGWLEEAKGKVLRVWLDPDDRGISHAIESLPFRS